MGHRTKCIRTYHQASYALKKVPSETVHGESSNKNNKILLKESKSEVYLSMSKVITIARKRSG